MASEFNVQVLATLRNRVSQGLSMIARDFGVAQRSVEGLQRSLNDLQTRHQLYAQRLRTTQALDRETNVGLQRRLSLMQQTATNEEMIHRQRISSMKAEAAEHARLNRAAEAKLDPLGAQMAFQQNTKVEAEDAQRIAAEEARGDARIAAQRLRVSELQAAISRRNTMGRLRDTENENRLLREQNTIRERQLAITEEQAAARRARIGHAFSLVGVTALVAGAAAFEVAKAGLPVGMYLQQIRQGSNLTPEQSRILPQMAMEMSTQSTQFNYKEVLRAMRTLIPRFGFQAIQSVGPSMFALAALERQRGNTESLGDMSLGTMQTLHTLRAKTPAQQAAVIDALTGMLVHAGVSTESFNSTLRNIGISTTTLPFQQRLRAGVLTQMAMSLGGAQSGLSGAEIGELFKALLTPRLGSQMGIIQLLNTKHLPLKGPHALSDILSIISQSPKGLTTAEKFLAGNQFNTLIALRNALHGGLLAKVSAALSSSMNPETQLAQSLKTGTPAMKNLAVSMENFVTHMGAAMGSPIAKAANWLAAGYSGVAGSKKGFWPWLGGFADYMAFHVPVSPYHWAHRLWALSHGPGSTISPIPGVMMDDPYHPPTTPYHVTIELDGRKLGEAVIGHARSHLRQSAKTMSHAYGTAAHPKVYPGR